MVRLSMAGMKKKLLNSMRVMSYVPVFCYARRTDERAADQDLLCRSISYLYGSKRMGTNKILVMMMIITLMVSMTTTMAMVMAVVSMTMKI